MMASSRAFASDAAGASASPPANAGGSAPAVNLGSSVGVAYENGTEVAADVAVDTQVQQWGYNVYAGSDTTGTSTAASLVSLGVSTEEDDDDGGRRRRRLKLIPRGSGYGRRVGSARTTTAEEDDAPLTLVLQNVRPVDYGDGASEQFVNLTCPPDFVGRVSAACPGTNSSVAVNCSGVYPTYDALGLLVDVANEWSTQLSCAVTVQPTCLLWNAALQAYDSTLCTPVNWTSTNTTCACSAEASALASEGGGASFTSGTDALAGSFASMFDASNMLAALLNPNPLLVATFFTILFLVILNMVLGIRADMRDNAAAWTHVEVAKMRARSRCAKLPHRSRTDSRWSSCAPRPASPRRTRCRRRSRRRAPSPTTPRPRCPTLCTTARSANRSAARSSRTTSGSPRLRGDPYDPIVPKYIRAQVELDAVALLRHRVRSGAVAVRRDRRNKRCVRTQVSGSRCSG